MCDGVLEIFKASVVVFGTNLLPTNENSIVRMSFIGSGYTLKGLKGNLHIELHKLRYVDLT